MCSFDPKHDLPDLSGKVILVTGGTAGLGRETIMHLAQHGHPRILFTGRNETSAREIIRNVHEINPRVHTCFIRCDLNDLEDVDKASCKITHSIHRLDIVFCNAGVMGTAPGLSKDGFENQFAINHLGHALLVRQLGDLLQRTTTHSDSDVRIIFDTSMGYQLASKINYKTIRTKQEALVLGGLKRYGQSKLANILFPQELALRYPDIISVSVDPGVIKTDLIKGLNTFSRYYTQVSSFGSQVTVAEGVKNQLWAATVPREKIVNGAFYQPVGRLGHLTPAAKNELFAAELWAWTDEVLAKY